MFVEVTEPQNGENRGRFGLSEEPKSPIPIVSVNPSPNMESFMEILKKSEDKTSMYVLMQLLDPNNLEYITEYPNTKYTKEMTKLNTWRKSVQYVFNLDDEDADEIVLEMCRQFMMKMTSHKRRRSQEIVMPLRHDPNQQTIYMENAKKRRWFGLG